MLRELSVLVAAVAITGCGATLISSAGGAGSPYAPLNDGTRVGLVKYSIDDPNFVIQRRRNDAYKKMYQSCGGPYVILAEGAAEENGRVITTITRSDSSSSTATPAGDTTQAGSQRTVQSVKERVADHYWYVQYRCATAADTTRGAG